MQFKKRSIFALLTTSLLAAFCAWAIFGSHAILGGVYTLPGHTPLALGESQLLRHSDPAQTQRIIVSLQLRDEAELDKLIEEQNDPASPNYQKFLTPDEFNKRFAPEQADVDAVTDFLKNKGLTVVEVTPNRTLVVAEGTVEQLENAFKVTINDYRLQHAGMVRQFSSNADDPKVPGNLKSVVQSVIGLNTLARYESRLKKAPLGPESMVRSGNAQQLPAGLSPQELATVYDFPNENNKNATRKLTGKGRTVAIATAEGYNRADVDEFWKTYGITRSGALTDIDIGGTVTTVNEETTLDLEQLGAQAPGADILMYKGVDPAFTTFTLVFNRIVTDNKADAMSVSWGLCEKWTGARQMKTEHGIFKQAAAQGIALFAASGDDGAYDCRGEKKVDYQVDYPSADPYVTAVGGTRMTSFDGKRLSERAWTGSGGGKSTEWKRQSWQKGPGVPGGDERVSADVSLNADPWTGYAIYYEGNWISAGGTSISAPNWTALWILASEAAGKRIGQASPMLYRAGNSGDYGKLFHDITAGDNGDFRGPGYPSGTGWDHPTGWGVPNGTALVDWIKGSVAAKPADPAQPALPQDKP